MQAKLIINVSDQPQPHSNGLSGAWLVPGKKPNEEFALLVVYPTPEIQDIGDQRRVRHWLKATPLAKDIIGLRSDAAAHGPGVSGSKEKWGLLLCDAEPDLPKELLQAFETETEFLNLNPPDVKMRKDNVSGAVVATNIEPPEVKDAKIKNSLRVQKLKEKFEAECRELVQKSEVQRAKRNLLVEDQRLISEGDRIWAGPEPGRININELHKNACNRLKQSRPWCYTPEQLEACPGCGGMIKENILICTHCQGRLFVGREKLMAMKPADRAAEMYPDLVSEEPVGATGKRA